MAILLVVVSHAWPTVLPSGGYGVTVFFVLSGFLITGLLLQEDKVDYRRFYWNRAVRLLPALAVVMTAYFVMSGRWRPVAWVAGYAANIGKILGNDLGAMSHAWSLAVEEHFYLVWPLIVGVTPKRWRWPAALAMFGVAFTWRVWQSATGEYWRVIIGTDTAAYALLAGGLLAVAINEGRLRPPSPMITLTAVAGVVGASALIPNPTYGYLWGDLPIVGLSVLAVAGCLQRVPALESPALVWFGTISYGLYLWHVPFLNTLWFHPGVALAVSAVVAWLSYQFVERPLRRRFHRLRSRDPLLNEVIPRRVSTPVYVDRQGRVATISSDS